MLPVLAVILIQSSPLGELAQRAPQSFQQGQSPSSAPRSDPELFFSLKGGKTVVVKQFMFSGNKAISTAQLERLTKPYLNQALSEQGLAEIRQRIEILYKSRGYMQAEVTVPAKQSAGTITFVIKEGKKTE